MLAPAPDARPHTPPSTRWRNYYRVFHVIDLGFGYWFPGIHPGPSVFASRDIAETHARAFLAMLDTPPPPGRPRRTLMEHAGAFPEGERGH